MVSHIDVGPGQYNPYSSNYGAKHNMTQQEKAYNLETPFPKKKTDVPFGSGQDRFKKFLPLNILPGPGQYTHNQINTDDQGNTAGAGFKSHSPRLQMYYELERTLSKSALNLDKQEMLAKQLDLLIDRQLKERYGGSNLISRSALNHSVDSPQAKKIIHGLAITSNIKQEKVPSIPYEPRKEEQNEVVGPATYNPNLDSIHKRLPNLVVIQKKEPLKPVPKKALESFINTIFQGDQPNTNDTIEKDRTSTTLRTKHIRVGKGTFSGAKTQVTSPRRASDDEDDINPFDKPTSIFLSKTKRSNLIDEKQLGPGVYNPHEYKQIGVKKESEFKKKVDFGSMEGRKFTMYRNLESPFKDSTYIQNPPSWKYQNPTKESQFYQKSPTRRADSLQLPPSFSSVAKVVESKNEIPGPGAYDINFKEELKVLDQKLSIRYQLGPFGSTAARFKEKPQTQPEAAVAQNDQKSQQIFNIIKKQEMRKYMDEALKLIKDMQKNQQSSIFKSNTERFKDPGSNASLMIQPSTQIGSLGGTLLEDSRLTEPSTMQSITNGPSTSRLKTNSVNPTTTASRPFDSSSPRFNYKKQEDHQKKQPGPGQYAMHYEDKEEKLRKEVMRSGTINNKYVPAIGTENRQKFSLFGQIVHKGQNSVLGPGSYETHALNGVASKKIFNASLLKPAVNGAFNSSLSVMNQSSLSTMKPSPRSTLS